MRSLGVRDANGPEGERGARRGNEVCEDGRTVDALAITADEGRGHAAKRPGEVLATGDPGDSEWGNPPGDWPGASEMLAGTGGTETSQYPEDKRGFPE